MKALTRRKTLIILFVTVCNAFCKADDLIIAGRDSHATIVLAKNASAVEKYAAVELRRTIRLMSGEDLPITDNSVDFSGARIIIGTPGTSDKILHAADRLKLAGATDEQIAVVRDGDVLYLAGKTPRAALYATYTFLEDYLGARWFWPGPSGEFLPRHENIRIDRLDIFESPGLKIRSLAITAVRNGDPDTDTWMARNKMNEVSVPVGADIDGQKTQARREKGFLTRIAGHNVVLSDELLLAHPEYAAEIGGKRQVQVAGMPVQLCWSNAAVQNAVASQIAKWWDDNPFLDYIHFYPVDNQRYCQCDKCKSMGDVSTRWQIFSRIVIAKLARTHPGKRYWTYAYQGYKKVPQTTAAPFDFIGYTLYDASYRDFLSGGSDYNKSAIAEMDGWLDRKVNLGIRGYEFIIFSKPMFVPMVSWVTDEMSWMRRKNMMGYMSELPPYGWPETALPENTYWVCNRMALYAAAKSLWNPGISADGIVTDWCNNIYGPAAQAMNAYYWEMEKAWRKAPGKISLYKNAAADETDHIFSPRLFEKLNDYFTRARTQSALIKDTVEQNRVEEQISLERRMLDNWQRVYHFKKGAADRYKTEIVKAANLIDPQWDSFPGLSPFEDGKGTLARDTTDVSLLWTPSMLALHIVCHDQNSAHLRAKKRRHDEKIMEDDCIELFIRPDIRKAGYMHFAVNAKGATYDAITKGGEQFYTAWNPAWEADVSFTKNAWIINVQIPFSSLGIIARDSSRFSMAIRRSGPSVNGISGWPDASRFNPSSFGLATLISEKTDRTFQRIILYDAGAKGAALSVAFQEHGWEVVSGVSGSKELAEKMAEDAGTLLIRYSEKNKELSNPLLIQEIRNYMEKGRVVVLAATGEIPVDKWFSVPAVKWTGNKNDPVRKCTFLSRGDWLLRPNNLATAMTRGITPQSAYEPSADGWEPLAKMNLQDGTAQPFLLTKRIGKGLLVLTSSAMGYGGGYEMFGNRNTENVVKLIKNLQALLNLPTFSMK